jgi:magnesium transporter
MARLLKPRSRKIGLPPGTPVHIGELRTAQTEVTVFEYNGEQLAERLLAADDLASVCPEVSQVTWVNVEGVGDLPLLQRLADCFAIHPLVAEDIVNTDQRPKAEEYDTYLYVVVKMLTATADGRFASEQMSLVLGADYLLTFQEGLAGDPFEPLRERLRGGKGRLRSQGADYLAYGLLDMIVDNYFLVLETLGERIEILEEEVIGAPTPTTIREIYRLKRELLFLHRAVWPLREVVNSLIRRESPFIKDSTIVYLRDLYDHTIQVVETLETLRDMVSGMLDIYLSSVSNRMNGIMKVLTIIATIFMPLTFIVGLYGMNFKHMPELELTWGYPAVLLMMVAVTAGMVVFFRKKKWL